MPTKLLIRCAVAVLTAACGVSIDRVAFAQLSAADKASAQVLFDSGRKLLKEGSYAEACARLEQSQALEPGIGNMLYLADCYEHLGRTASAWALFVEAASRAAAVGEGERASVGRARAERLKPRLSSLTLYVPEKHALAGLELLRDAQAVAPGLWGVAVPVDPGDHPVVARAPGHIEWSHVVRIDANATGATTTIPLLDEAPAREAVQSAMHSASEEPEATLAPALNNAPLITSEHHASSAPVMPIVGASLAGVGAVALIVGAVFGTRAIVKNNEAKDFCPGGGPVCTDVRGVTLTNAADSAATTSNVLVIGGAAALIGGAIVYFTSPSEPEHSKVGLAVGANVLGLTLTEKF